MPPKSKAKKGGSADKVVTPKRRTKQPAHKSQPPPTYSPTPSDELSAHNRTETHPIESETSQNTVMDMLVNISSRSSVTEHFVDELRADKDAEATRRDQSPSIMHLDTCRVQPQRQQVPNEPQQAAPTAVANLSDAVRAKVASQMRWAPVMDLITSEEDSDLGEEATAATRKKG